MSFCRRAVQHKGGMGEEYRDIYIIAHPFAVDILPPVLQRDALLKLTVLGRGARASATSSAFSLPPSAALFLRIASILAFSRLKLSRLPVTADS